LSAVYLKDEWTFRVATSKSTVLNFESVPFKTLIDGLNKVTSMNLWPQAEYFARGFEQGHRIKYSALGLAYDNDNWLIQSEVGTTKSDWMIIPSNINGYLSVGYRVNEMTYFGGLAMAKNKKDRVDVLRPDSLAYLPEGFKLRATELIDATEYIIKRTTVEQKNLNIGAKWYYSDKVVFKVQADHFIIEPTGGGLWDINEVSDIDIEHNVNLISFSASLVF
jgi:hypothetical protein